MQRLGDGRAKSGTVSDGRRLVNEVLHHAASARLHLRQQGLSHTLTRSARFLDARLARHRTIARRQSRMFAIGAATLPYELGRHNAAWLTERSVEISVAKHVLSGIAPSSVLEVGNVLPHFGRAGHTVVDKYDTAPGLVNEDILDYHPDRTFDAVVAVSTLEHVGFDRPEKPDRDAPTAALAAMRGLLSPTGILLVTVPIGYNPGLDARIADGRFACARHYCLRRVSADNDWVETELRHGLRARYGAPYVDGNVVYVGLDGPGVTAARL